MKLSSRIFTILTIILAIMSSYLLVTHAAVSIPGGDIINNSSIQLNNSINSGGNSIDNAKTFGFTLLGFAKIFVSGLALIYMVMIGIQMIIGSDSEETVKTQRKQITYTLIGFLFLNVPSMVYQVFNPEGAGSHTMGETPSWRETGGNIFWNTAGFEGFFGNIIAFLRVFVFGAAVTMFSWGFFRLIVSAGDDEKRKAAKNRIVYGFLGLVFMGFVELWGHLVSTGDITGQIPSVGKQIFNLALYIGAPLAIFMLMWGAYYMITSAGDEERTKKGKSIVVNTFIACIILLTAMSFLTELSNFRL